MIWNLTEELPPLTKEEVRQVFIDTLDLLSGFSILFLQCSPAEANRLIPRVRQEFPKKNIEVLDLVEPIDNLYKLVEGRVDRTSLNILFVRGLEKSLQADIKPGYKGLGEYYNLNTVPPILSHLNQQRENFRDHFGNICFVFVLPKFAVKYFVRRAPDFYDWNSGVFEIADLSSRNILSSSLIDQANNLVDLGRYEEAIAFYDKAFSVNKHTLEDKRIAQVAWYNKGLSLHKLGRYEQAILSYDQAVVIEPFLPVDLLDIYMRAILDLGWSKIDLRVGIKPDSQENQFWYNRGIALQKLGRYKEASRSFNRAFANQVDNIQFLKRENLVHFFTSDYQAALFKITWQQAFKNTCDTRVPRYREDISRLIQEFIEALIPRFTQPPVQQTLLIPLLTIYKEANVITELGVALVNTLHLIAAPAISNHTAAEWLSLWRTSSFGNEPAMEQPLRLMSTAIEYKKDPSKRQRLWLNLPSEERLILDKALKLVE
jgi:tetratricopeptide (TPR) repeat protein